ncbi:putative DNA-binding protein [Bombilactobacillus folatiphilus]|uniref:UPF0122 protein MOO45_05135 n=1 Tax=Bombilactobacillus folatiphilus TaxID=2923362 RepID=A0ABY4P7B9_9LACO|nr:putative DNA-binding protein [Bombilactobacillus folatiphilus]UQS81603.1 putative DNA-binding protein [Bombilactobacillus folatiphilus]
MDNNLAQKNEINILYSFYQPLLTQKQDQYMQLYYGDDLSLGEIAQNYQVSRQAVYDNLKRTVQLLRNYEQKLHLWRDFQQREQLLVDLQQRLIQQDPQDQDLLSLVTRLQALDA